MACTPEPYLINLAVVAVLLFTGMVSFERWRIRRRRQ